MYKIELRKIELLNPIDFREITGVITINNEIVEASSLNALIDKLKIYIIDQIGLNRASTQVERCIRHQECFYLHTPVLHFTLYPMNNGKDLEEDDLFFIINSLKRL